MKNVHRLINLICDILDSPKSCHDNRKTNIGRRPTKCYSVNLALVVFFIYTHLHVPLMQGSSKKVTRQISMGMVRLNRGPVMGGCLVDILTAPAHQGEL